MNPETVIALCEKDMTFVKQQRKHYRKLVKTDPSHLLVQLSYLYAKSLLSQPQVTSNKPCDKESEEKSRDTTLLDENNELKDEINELKDQINELKEQNERFRQRIEVLRTHNVPKLKQDLSYYKQQYDNQTEIIKELRRENEILKGNPIQTKRPTLSMLY